MSTLLKSVAAGAASGAITFGVSTIAMSATSTLSPPLGITHQTWAPVVTLGLSAGLIAALVHFLSIRVLAARLLPSLAAFAVTVAGIMVASGLIIFLSKALLAWLVGALIASAVQHLLGGELTPQVQHSE